MAPSVVRTYRDLAAYWGREAAKHLRRLDPAECYDPYNIDDEYAVACAVRAAHIAHEAERLEENAQAPLRTLQANSMSQARRLAMQVRCPYRRVQAHTDEKTGEVAHEIGDPCGGILKAVKRYRELTGFQCETCGRFYPKAADTPDTPEASASTKEVA